MMTTILAILLILFYTFWLARALVGLTITTLRVPIVFRRRFSRREIESHLVLLAAASFQLAFALCLVVMLDVKFVETVDTTWIITAIFIGLGEGGLAISLGAAAIALAKWWDRSAGTMEAWLVLSQGGWMRHFSVTFRLSPKFALCMVLLFICGEELIYRGVVLHITDSLSVENAVGASTGLFILSQLANMPSWRTAMLPCIGALVVGPAHGWLFLQTGDIELLVLAHLIFFIVSAHFVRFR
jgi:hypothetical protein